MFEEHIENEAKVAAPAASQAPLHKQHLHPFIGWSLLLCAFALALPPMLTKAQEMMGPPPSGTMGPPEGSSMAPPPGTMGPPTGSSQPGYGQGYQTPGPGGQGYVNAPDFLPGQPGGQQPGGQQGGPDQAAIEKMQAQALQKLQSSMGSVMKQVAKVKAKIAVYQKKGLKIPEELTSAIAAVEDLVPKIKAAKTMDEAQSAGDIGDVMGNFGDALQTHMPDLERLSNLPKIYSRIDKALKTFDKNLASDKKQAAKSKINLNSQVADFEAALNKVKDAYAAAKAQIDGGNVSDGFDSLQSDVFDSFQDLGEMHGAIQQLAGITKAIPQINSELKNYQTQLNRLKAKGKDIAEAQSILDEGKAKLAELKAAAADPKPDSETISGIIDDLNNIRDRFLEVFNPLAGIQPSQQNELDTGLNIPTYQMPDFASMGFNRQQPAEGTPPEGQPGGMQGGFGPPGGMPNYQQGGPVPAPINPQVPQIPQGYGQPPAYPQ